MKSMTGQFCDGCRKLRRDVQACGRDSNGDPDAPDLCFLCRKENERGRIWDTKRNAYVPEALFFGEKDESREVE